MYNVHERVYVADETACRIGDYETAVVHACKSPCHQRAVGYRGNLPKTHPNYLYLRKDNDLYLNVIDPPIPLFPDDLFATFFSFAREILDSGRKLVIHCNKGESRAPSFSLLLLAKHLNVISNESYDSARKDFLRIFPDYIPGKGIEKYLTENWKKLDSF